MKLLSDRTAAARLRMALVLSASALACSLQAQPTTNPVTDSGIDTGAYDTSWIAALPWSTVYDVTTDTTLSPNAVTPDDTVLNFDGTIAIGDDLADVQAKIDALSALGGGVLFFPAGDYAFSDTLYLADGVIIRGATPVESDCRGSYSSSGGLRTYTLTYDPQTNFNFPIYTHSQADDMTFVGGTRGKFFKSIEVRNPTTDSNYGLVNVDIQGAVISVGARNSNNLSNNITWGVPIPKNQISAKQILIFGNRLNNGAILEPNVPQKDTQTSGSLVIGRKYMIAIANAGDDFTNVGAANNNVGTVFTATGTTPASWASASQLWHYEGGTPGSNRQNRWQIWPTRTRGKIDVVSGGNTLIANNLVNDLYYKHYVVGSEPASSIMDYPALLKNTVTLPPKTTQYLVNNGTELNANNNDDTVHFADGYGIRLNHVLDYVTAHSAVQEPSKHRDGQGMINNWVFGTTRVGIMGAGNGLVVKGNVRDDFHTTKYEYIREDGTGTSAIIGANTLENRGMDVTGGHSVIVEDNYVKVTRGMTASGYLTTDGEGLLLQESSSTQHPSNWIVRNNTTHSYLGIYRVVQADGILFEGNTVYGDPIYTDGVRNGSIGHVGGVVAFKDNTASSVYAKYNVVPRNQVVFDLGGNTPAAQAVVGGNGTPSNPGPYAVDGTLGVTILYPSKGDVITEGSTINVQVLVTRHADDVTAIDGVKLWDGVTNYPANGQMAAGYWTFDGLTVGQPAGIALALTDPDPITGAIGGGIYTGSWTVPTGFNDYGLLIAEARLLAQTTDVGSWTEKGWGFQAEVTPVGVPVEVSGLNVNLTVPTVVGQKYQLEYSDATTPLAGTNELLGTWIPVGAPVAGTGGNIVMSDPGAPAAGESRFYRVAVMD